MLSHLEIFDSFRFFYRLMAFLNLILASFKCVPLIDKVSTIPVPNFNLSGFISISLKHNRRTLSIQNEIIKLNICCWHLLLPFTALANKPSNVVRKICPMCFSLISCKSDGRIKLLLSKLLALLSFIVQLFRRKNAVIIG